MRRGNVGIASLDNATVLILDEQTLLAVRTWLAGDGEVIGETIASAAGAAAVGFALALWLSPSLNMLALGERMAQGQRVAAENAPARAADHRLPYYGAAVSSCRTDQVYRTRGAG